MSARDRSEEPRRHLFARAIGHTPAGRVLRALAGSTMGWRQSRRGSFLILVVGTLAMLSVITVVYFSIGKADRRTGAALKRQSQADEVPAAYADYISQIIADDTLDALDSNDDGFVDLRETWDYPHTSSVWRSQTANLDERFSAAGRGDNPWLASTLPTRVTTSASDMPTGAPSEQQDWLHVSNVAPDGSFVNLSGLRGNFLADVDTMREELRLADGTPWNYRNDPPSLMTSNVLGMFRAAVDLDNNPAEPEYLFNQWADADGDGMADSGWHEMVDASIPNEDVRRLLQLDSRYRYFFATRIIDLSALVNVNTATDVDPSTGALVQPTKDHPIGMTPADVDLFRILRGSDGLDMGFSYDLLHQPDSSDRDEENYEGYAGVCETMTGPASYGLLRLQLTPADVNTMEWGLCQFKSKIDPFGNGVGPFLRWEDKERAAYYSLIGGSPTGLFLDSTGASGSNQVLITGSQFGLADLAELLTFRGSNDPQKLSNLERVLGGHEQLVGGANAKYGILRDNRSDDIERRSRDLDGDGDTDPETYAWAQTDVRQLLTTISGSRPFRTTFGVDPDEIEESELKAVAEDVANPALFRIYADSLLPYAGASQSTWDPNADQFDTLHYGLNPEIALRTSAHLAANWEAQASGSTKPVVYTLLIEDSFAFNLLDPELESETPIASRTPVTNWAWWVEGKTLRLPATRIADRINRPADLPQAPAMNIYGVTAQPVIAEVASLYLYHDASTRHGGDQEWDKGGVGDSDGSFPPGGPGNTQPRPGTVTIDGTVSDGNSDFLGQFIAFQITNPFDETIQLSNEYPQANPDPEISPADRFEYYIEFAGRYYRIAALDPDNTGAAPERVALGAGESRVFFISCADLQSLQSRWQTYGALGTSPVSGPAGVIRSWLSKQFSLDGGATEPVWMEQFDPRTGAKIDFQAGVVDLMTVDPSIAPYEPTNTEIRLWRALRNDDPYNPTQDESLTASGEDPSNDPLPAQYLFNDQLVDRLHVKGGASLDRSLKNDATPKPGRRGQEIDGADAWPEDDPRPSNYNTGFTIATWASCRRPDDPQSGAMPTGGVPSYLFEAKDPGKNLNVNEAGPSGTDDIEDLDLAVFQAGEGAYETFAEFVTAQLDNGGTETSPLIETIAQEPSLKAGNALGSNDDPVPASFTDLRPEIRPIDTDKLRPGDMLLPLAVGPSYEFKGTGETHMQRWTTLGEALALALNYDNVSDPDNILVDFGKRDDTTTPRIVPKTDRGQLVLDAYVPFEDTSTDGILDTSAGEFAWGLGIPLALTVVDQFTTFDEEYGGMYTAQRGLVNINTAPVQVARALPMLSPATVDGGDFWWWISGMQHDAQSDIASTLVGYRDKGIVLPKDGSTPTNFYDKFVGGVEDGRALATEVPGIRETPGFRSVGELLLLRDRVTYPVVAGGGGYPMPHSIDRLAYDGFPIEHPNAGIDSADYDGSPDEIVDDYDEKIAIANAAFASTTTRSDYFAVWFLVHGYQESDVTGLQPLDRLLPSISRRFLMVVDRSNVRVRGDKPRIILFKEVPL